MSKRRLSLNMTVSPPTKRATRPISTPVNFGLTLYDEVVLNIFSYLTSYHDLCALQRTNSNWARLSLDNQLWRALYLREFGKLRLRGGRGFSAYATTRFDGRGVRPLPSRAHNHLETVKDWKWMFRISSNWRRGRCASEELKWDASDDPALPIHLALAGGYIITASSSPSSLPEIFLHRPQLPPFSIAAPSISWDDSAKITALALDQSQPTGSECRLAVFYSTGYFCLFLASPSDPKETMELSYIPITRRHRTTSVVQAVYHHPLLITLSSTFDLTLYESSSNTSTGIRATQTLTSFTSYPPTSLTLSHPSPGVYKLVLAYAIPTYPSHWTVAVTELAISSFTVQSTHTSSTLDPTPGWKPLTPALSETLRDQYSRKVSKVSCISSDGRYVVLAGAETNVIQLYRLVASSRTTGHKLSFLRTLFGHASPVQALCVADGRCVSLSCDGSLWVWDLERGGVEVDSSKDLTELPETVKIAFDERRILIFSKGRIIVRSFDM